MSYLTARSGAPRALPSFPTRRSSDLVRAERREYVRARLRTRGRGEGTRGVLDMPALGVEDAAEECEQRVRVVRRDRKSTRPNSSHLGISYAVFCLKKKK